MSRGGAAFNRRELKSKERWQVVAAGKTGSKRNGGAGFHKVPIKDRHPVSELNPVTVKTKAPHGPLCDRNHPMHLEEGKHRNFFWVCYPCKTAIAYKPLRTGLKHAS